MKKIAVIMAMFLLAGCSSAASGKEDRSVSSETTKSSSSVASAQDTVTFGNYQNEKIEWYVLDEKDGKTLLLSVHALDSRPFNDGPATWDNSSLRSWLNGDFYNEAFSGEEQKEIQLTRLDNGDDLKYGTTVGTNTEDHVFLLSASEAKEYLNKKETVTSPTEYAASQGAYTNENGDCAWWLRSPGMDDEGPAYYSSQGDIGTRAHKGSESIIGVRPAVWVSNDVLSE